MFLFHLFCRLLSVGYKQGGSTWRRRRVVALGEKYIGNLYNFGILWIFFCKKNTTWLMWKAFSHVSGVASILTGSPFAYSLHYSHRCCKNSIIIIRYLLIWVLLEEEQSVFWWMQLLLCRVESIKETSSWVSKQSKWQLFLKMKYI